MAPLRGPVSVLGPGTGFGVALLVGDAQRGWQPVETEGGHVTLAPIGEEEHAIVRWMDAQACPSGAALAQLARHPGRVITQQQLLKDIWGPTHVEDSHYLRIVVAHVRQKLGDDPTAPRFIVTEPGVGYRLIGPEQV